MKLRNVILVKTNKKLFFYENDFSGFVVVDVAVECVFVDRVVDEILLQKTLFLLLLLKLMKKHYKIDLHE